MLCFGNTVNSIVISESFENALWAEETMIFSDKFIKIYWIEFLIHLS